MKQYEIELREKHGSMTYTKIGMVLAAESKPKAIDFAKEIFIGQSLSQLDEGKYPANHINSLFAEGNRRIIKEEDFENGRYCIRANLLK